MSWEHDGSFRSGIGVKPGYTRRDSASNHGRFGHWRDGVGAVATGIAPGRHRSVRGELVILGRRDESAPSGVNSSARRTRFLARSGSLLRESVTMKYQMIQRCRETFPFRLMYRCLRVLPRGYYGWGTRLRSARAPENARLVSCMRTLHTEHDGVALGSPRLCEELRDVLDPMPRAAGTIHYRER